MNETQNFIAYSRQGELEFTDSEAVRQFLLLNPGEVFINIGKNRRKTPRTTPQNSSIHLYCDMVAQELNNAGLDMQIALKLGVNVPWTMETVKAIIWKPIQQAQLGKESTTQLETTEVSKVYETINRFLGERGVHVPFPSRNFPENEPVFIDNRSNF